MCFRSDAYASGRWFKNRGLDFSTASQVNVRLAQAADRLLPAGPLSINQIGDSLSPVPNTV